MGIGFIGVADLKGENILTRREIPPVIGGHEKKHHEKEPAILFVPRFHDISIGLSDVTIDTPPLKDQVELDFRRKNTPKTYKDVTSLIRSVEYCLNKSIISNHEGEGSAIGVCRMRNKNAVVGERFWYGSFMEKNKDPVEMVKSLDKRCRERGGKIQSVFVPL